MLLVENLVAVSVVVVVGGGLLGIVLKSLLGARREEKQLEEIARAFKTKDPKSGGKKT